VTDAEVFLNEKPEAQEGIVEAMPTSGEGFAARKARRMTGTDLLYRL